MIWRVLPFRSGNFQHILIQIPTPGISSTIFTQRLSADNLPSKGSSKSDGGLGASSAFRYTSANGDARVLSHYTCFSCTLTTFLVGKSLHCLLFSLIQQALRKNGKDRGKSFLMRWYLLVKRVGQQLYHLNRPRQHKTAFPNL